MTLAITVTDNDVLVPALRKGELDLIVNFLPEAPLRAALRAVAEDDIVVMHPPIILAGKGSCDGGARQERWVLSPMNMLPWHWLCRAFLGEVTLPQIAVETRSVRLASRP